MKRWGEIFGVTDGFLKINKYSSFNNHRLGQSHSSGHRCPHQWDKRARRRLNKPTTPPVL